MFFKKYTRRNKTAKNIKNKMLFFSNLSAFAIANEQFAKGFGVFSQDFNEDYYRYIVNSYFVQKLTYKDKNPLKNPNSYYWHIIDEYKNEAVTKQQ